METKEVYVESCIYRSPDTGYCVLLTTEKGTELVVVGHFQGEVLGETLRITGTETYHPSYGPQFKVESYEIVLPTDEEGIRRYLASGAIKGIGQALAARIVTAFGEDTLRIMDEEPERLAEVKGISLRKARELGIIIEEKRDLRKGLVFLQQYGISNRLAIRIYEFYGDDVFEVMRENPYRLAEDIEGIGFLTADQIARSMGIDKASERRIKSGILYVLLNELSQGNTYLPEEVLKSEAEKLLDIPLSDITVQLSNLAMEGRVKLEKGRVFPYSAYMAEQRVAKRLTEHNWNEEGEYEMAGLLIEAVEKNSGYVLDELQKKAVCESAGSGVFILTGGPGTGKTTTINAMIKVFTARKKELVLAAPTGRAAKRMSEATGYPAKTIHRLLEVKPIEGGRPGFDKNEDNPLEADVVIVDEMSMVDIFLFQALLRALPSHAHLVLVGDPNQLPSVGPGRVLYDLLSSGLFPAVCLKKVFRQAEDSDIVMNAHAIQRGEMIKLDNKSSDFFFLGRDDVNTIHGNILTLVTRQLPRHLGAGIGDIQVLTPVKKGPLGVESLNSLLQKYINPPAKGKAEYVFGDKLLRTGDKVMQVKNDYQLIWKIRGINNIVIEDGEGVFNGDVGIITDIDEGQRLITVLFDEEREVVYTYEQSEHLELAYAMTIHKSQGSEYPAVVLVLLGVPVSMEYRNLLYTAVTRAKKCVTIIGESRIVEEMIRGEDRQVRYSALSDRLSEMSMMKGESFA